MDATLKDTFIQRWQTYFPGAELPITFYYADDLGDVALAEVTDNTQCFIAQLAVVRRGESQCFTVDTMVCPGAKKYVGFSQTVMPNFEYFLSCGIPGKLEGERYKKTPEMVKDLVEKAPEFVAPAPYIVFKRWDRLERDDDPEVVIFYAKPDALSGLFTLAGFDETDPSAVIAPFSAGCGSIVQHPYVQKDADHPKGVLGMFDVSARPWVQKDILTFAAPIARFAQMVDNMPESFLITPSWDRVKRRL